MLYFDYSSFLGKGETDQWILFRENVLEKQSTCSPRLALSLSTNRAATICFSTVSTVSIISPIIITIYRYIGYALWFPYSPAYHLTMSCLPLAHRYVFPLCICYLCTDNNELLCAEASQSQAQVTIYYNNTYCFTRMIIIITSTAHICWPRHLPSLTIFTSAHSPIWQSCDVCRNLVCITQSRITTYCRVVCCSSSTHKHSNSL